MFISSFIIQHNRDLSSICIYICVCVSNNDVVLPLSLLILSTSLSTPYHALLLCFLLILFFPLPIATHYWTQKMLNISVSPSSMTFPSVSSWCRNPISKLPQFSQALSSLAATNSHNGLPCAKLACPPSYLCLGLHKSASFIVPIRKNVNFEVAATLVPEANSDEPTKSDTLVQTLQLGAMFGIWYVLNIYFNIYNKQVLNFPRLFIIPLWFDLLLS